MGRSVVRMTQLGLSGNFATREGPTRRLPSGGTVLDTVASRLSIQASRFSLFAVKVTPALGPMTFSRDE